MPVLRPTVQPTVQPPVLQATEPVAYFKVLPKRMVLPKVSSSNRERRETSDTEDMTDNDSGLDRETSEPKRTANSSVQHSVIKANVPRRVIIDDSSTNPGTMPESKLTLVPRRILHDNAHVTIVDTYDHGRRASNHGYQNDLFRYHGNQSGCYGNLNHQSDRQDTADTNSTIRSSDSIKLPRSSSESDEQPLKRKPIVKIKDIPRFSGEKMEDFDQWKHESTYFLDSLDVPESDRVNLLTMGLGGVARKLVAKRTNIGNSSDLFATLATFFKRPGAEVHDALTTKQQPHETVASFAARLQANFHDAEISGSSKSIDAMLLHLFIQNITPEYSQRLKMWGPSTFNAAF